ncbi:hypothetical protein [Grimontia hollisae]|uniref:hypothetical protein n=1 Tax=Grimontia hollisae TaxID=673 RepID=UPI000DF8E8B0|nr:hypothetical protein [Grimontia hollisae]STQ75503.1 phage-associated protein, BcepMu gp16 family [Grimontia hollisae]
MKVDTAYEICGALKAQGYSVAAWANEKGFHPRTVHHCIKNFAPECKKKPRRKLAKQIMNELGKTLNAEELRTDHE